MAAGIDVTTLEDVKHYGKQPITWDEEDDLLNQFINLVSNLFERYLDRPLKSASQTEYFDVYPGQTKFYLKAWPASAVSAVYSDSSWDFSSAMDSSSYMLFDNRLLIVKSPESVVNGARALKVTYTGGMALTAEAFISAYPDIATAANMQIWHWKGRVGEEDAQAINVGGGQSISVAPPMNLLPAVKKILNAHRSVHP